MKYKKTKTKLCSGNILGYTIKKNSFILKKGHKLSQSDIKKLEKENIDYVYTASLDKEDIQENAAASFIAKKLIGNKTNIKKAFTGRCNIYSKEYGLVKINDKIINKINTLSSSITIATIPPWSLVNKNQMLATVKIIPFAVNSSLIKKVIVKTINQKPIIEVKPISSHNVGVIITKLPNTRNSIIDKSSNNIKTRIEKYGSEISKEIICNHDESSISNSIKYLIELKCSPILISGAAAIVDQNDIIPLSIKQTGGKVIHFGMPVDPGNLLLLGKYKSTSIIGLPGCARSLKLNGLDWVLWRIFANINISSKDIQMLGVGGLLNEIHSRPQSRENE
ncbi:molybdopterin-binding protein [Alphaproteobacteria bacterium]|nr:molybdopterin-binding protein [Alphaproteobacteria bacterium]